MSVGLSTEAKRSLEAVKQQLKEQKELEGSNVKTDLYAHLTEVFNRVLQYHPTDAFEKFEEISTMVKETNLKFADPRPDFEINANNNHAAHQEAVALIAKAKNLINGVPDVGVSPLDKDLLSKDNTCIIPNLAEQAAMLEWAGIDFGQDNTFLLQKALKRLAVLSGATQLKFFGKIYGTQKDYWVVQGKLGFTEEEPENDTIEPRGQGANAVVFWVTDSLLNDWIQLPDAQPETLQVSRLIKHVFTGNLNTPIDSNPPFPGKERHLLRAQLARIMHATEIVPKGIYEVDEETNEVRMAEEPANPGTEELKSLENWSHMHPVLLKVGRCSHIAPTDMGEEEKEEYMAKLAEEDKVEERFKAINEDVPVPSVETAWLSRVCGDTQTYNKGEGTVTYAVNVLTSLRWPGSVTVAKNG